MTNPFLDWHHMRKITTQKEKTKVYTYTRGSTAMQVDGYSLDAQKARMKAYADYNDYEIVGEYEDAGKSGKSIEGRAQFSQMMEDIKSGKDGIDSSKDAGKLMLSVLSAVAEIERGETMVLLSKL